MLGQRSAEGGETQSVAGSARRAQRRRQSTPWGVVSAFPIVSAAREGGAASEYVKSCDFIIRRLRLRLAAAIMSVGGGIHAGHRRLSLHFYYLFRWLIGASLSFPELHFGFAVIIVSIVCLGRAYPRQSSFRSAKTSSFGRLCGACPEAVGDCDCTPDPFCAPALVFALGGQSLHHTTRIQRGGARTSVCPIPFQRRLALRCGVSGRSTSSGVLSAR